MSDAETHVERVAGSRIRRATPAPWGSKNRTMIVELEDGRELVLQEYADRITAGVRLHAARQLAPPLIDHGVPVPRVLMQDLSGDVPWAAFERMPGEPGYVAADHDLSGETFPAIAEQMGLLLRRFGELNPSDFDLPALWADPDALADAARQWVTNLEAHLTPDDAAAVRDIINRVPHLFDDRPTAVCHGDFGPQNVLVLDGRVSALLDLEDARLGDPLLDVAWWAWLIRAHTPAAFSATWTRFLGAAGLDPSADSFDERLLALIVLRLLETAEAYRLWAPEKHPGWATRVSRTLEWRGMSLS